MRVCVPCGQPVTVPSRWTGTGTQPVTVPSRWTGTGTWPQRPCPTGLYSPLVRTVVGIAVAGALGALARYGLEGVVSRRSPGAFPWGTFVVNVTGAFVLGFLFTLMTERLETAPWLRSTVTIGFLGAYTTFSTLAFESYRLGEDGAW